MLIDWFTVCAQALNFLVLLWLLKRYLYRPILDAIDAREKRIAAQLADADLMRAEAQREREEFEQKNEAFEQRRDAMMNMASEEAAAERQRLVETARQEADSLVTARREALREEARNLHETLGTNMQREIFAISRQALRDLATTSLEERMAEVFMRRLREMDVEARAILGGALKAAAEPALVRSAFDLPPAQRAAIQAAINEAFGTDVRLGFETAPELIGGIELSTIGQKLGWSIADYVATMERSVSEFLADRETPAGHSRVDSAVAGPDSASK